MRRVLTLLLLAALPALGETVVYEPCTQEPPLSEYDKPSCADYELHNALIASAEAGDASALAWLEKRHAIADTYEERHRIAAVLLRRVADDSAIWNGIYADAQLAVRFAGDREGLAQWCEERDCYSVRHGYVLYDAFGVAASDPRARGLLVQALAADDRDVVYSAIAGLATQRDLTSLAAIDEALARHPEEAQYVARVLSDFRDPRADAIMKKYVVEEEKVEEAADEDDEEEQ